MRVAALVLASSLAWTAHGADTDTKKKAEPPARWKAPAKSEPAAKSPPATRSGPEHRHATRSAEEKKPERASVSPKFRANAPPLQTESTERGSSPKRQAERDQPVSAPVAARKSAPAPLPAPTAQDALREARDRRALIERQDLKIDRDEAKAAASPAPTKTAPRLPVAAEPTSQMTCRANPACPEPNHICFPVEHTYGGGQNIFAAARQDTLRACLRSNAGDPCCAQQCSAAVQCTAR